MTTELDIGLIFDTHMCTLEDITDGAQYGDAGAIIRNVRYSTSVRLRRHPYVLASILKMINLCNKKDVDFTVWGGDLIQSGTQGEMRANFQAFVAALATLNKKFYPIAGHHDVWGNDYTEFFDETYGLGTLFPTEANTPDNPVWWPATAPTDSPFAYSVVVNNFKCIFLCALMGAVGLNEDSAGYITGEIESTQMEWFEARLAEAKAADQHVIVFSHQPFKYDLSLSALLTPIKGADLGIAALEQYYIDTGLECVVCSGHTHKECGDYYVNGVHYFKFRGDVCAKNADDTGRFSHSVLKIISGDPLRVYRTGYGYDWDGSRNINTLFTDDFNNDYTDKWTKGDGQAYVTEEDGILKLTADGNDNTLTANNIELIVGKYYRVDFEITHKDVIEDSNIQIMVGGTYPADEGINVKDYAIGKHSVVVAAKNPGNLYLWWGSAPGGIDVRLNSLTIKEEVFLVG